ncbi:MAG: hypothetical protein AAB520_00880 [Patescibacteria group bacterium]
MSKRTARSRKRVHHRAKPSHLAALFTFPKFVLYAFIALSLIFLYQISLPSRDVKGDSTISEDKFYTESEVEALVKNNGFSINWKNFVATTLWTDSNKDGKGANEYCLDKKYTFKIYNKNRKLLKTRTKNADSNCEANYTYHKDKDDCHYIQFVSTEGNSYKLVSMRYTDKKNTDKVLSGKNLPKDKTIKVCGYPILVGDGGRANEVNFGVKK